MFLQANKVRQSLVVSKSSSFDARSKASPPHLYLPYNLKSNFVSSSRLEPEESIGSSFRPCPFQKSQFLHLCPIQKLLQAHKARQSNTSSNASISPSHLSLPYNFESNFVSSSRWVPKKSTISSSSASAPSFVPLSKTSPSPQSKTQSHASSNASISPPHLSLPYNSISNIVSSTHLESEKSTSSSSSVPLSKVLVPSSVPLSKISPSTQSETESHASSNASISLPHLSLPYNFESNFISSYHWVPKNSTNSSSSASLSKASVVPNDGESRKKNKKEAIPRFEIPEHLQELIKNDIVPPVLNKPLSPSTYGEYFAAPLHVEGFYCEKWNDYLLEDVSLELQSKEIFEFQKQPWNKQSKKNSNKNRSMVKNEYFVTFEISRVPEERPYLLSRDYFLLRPSGRGKHFQSFQGVIYRVWKSKTVLTDFPEDFFKQHKESNKYDVSFSFNRVCLKRAHRAVSATTNPLLLQILFPNPTKYPTNPCSLTDRILQHNSGPIPYLIEGPLSDTINGDLTSMGNIIKEIVFNVYKNFSEARILICAPRNRTCDAFMRDLMVKDDKCELFRANAAFRDATLVPDDIFEASSFEGECFTCPPLCDLQNFRIIVSTFISAFRLHDAGLKSSHFTHIFLVDASSCIEPEIIVPLSDLSSEDMVLVITGSERDVPGRVRSDIGRKKGLQKSFFQRLMEREPYCMGDAMFLTRIREKA